MIYLTLSRSSHFVGYVEDGESVEMIMKKFEALQEYEKQTGQASLNETDLEQVFKLTSNFTVQSTMGQSEFDELQYVPFEDWDFSSE